MMTVALVMRFLFTFHGAIHGIAYWGPHGGDDPIMVRQDAHCRTWERVNISYDVCR